MGRSTFGRAPARRRFARGHLALAAVSVAAITAACALAASVSASARPATPAAPIHLAPFAHFNFPTEIATTPADPYAVYVAERSGRVYIVRFGRKIRHPFLDIHKSIAIGPNSEQGLVGMTFSPKIGRASCRERV